MTQLSVSLQSMGMATYLEAHPRAEAPSIPAKPAQETWADWRASDYKAGRIIVVVMNAIFLTALVLYGSIALVVALGYQP